MANKTEQVKYQYLLDTKQWESEMHGLESSIKGTDKSMLKWTDTVDTAGRKMDALTIDISENQREIIQQSKSVLTANNRLSLYEDTLSKTGLEVRNCTQLMNMFESQIDQVSGEMNALIVSTTSADQQTDEFKNSVILAESAVNDYGNELLNTSNQMRIYDSTAQGTNSSLMETNKQLDANGKSSQVLNAEFVALDKNSKALWNTLSAVDLGLIASAFASAGVAMGVCIKNASDLTEVMNIIDVVFEENAATVIEWSETSIEAMGISQLAALKTAGMFAAMGESMGLTTTEAHKMALELTQLSADMASFYNISQQRAALALTGVYTGETEALKRLGINIQVANLEQFGYNENMTASEKILVRYNSVMAQTINQQGDFARTSSSLSNQVRILKQSITDLSLTLGVLLEPAASATVGLLNDLLSAVDVLIGPTSTLGGILVDLADGMEAFKESIGLDTRDLITELATAMDELFQEIEPLLTAIGKLVGIIASLAGLAIPAAIASITRIVEIITGAIDSFKTWAAESELLQAILDLIAVVLERIWEIISRVITIISEVITWIIEWAEQSKLLDIIMVILAKALEIIERIISKVVDVITRVIIKITEWIEESKLLNIILLILAGIIAAVAASIIIIIGLIKSVIDIIQEFVDKIQALVDMFVEWFNSQEQIQALLQALYDLVVNIIEIIQGFIQMIKDIIIAIKDWIETSKLIDALLAIMAWALDLVKRAIELLIAAIRQIIDWITQVVDWFTEWWNSSVLVQTVLEAIESVIDRISGAIQTVIGWVKSIVDWFNSWWDVGLLVEKVMNGIAKAIEIVTGFVNGLIEAITWLIDKFNELIDTVQGWFEGGFDIGGGLNFGEESTATITGAQGVGVPIGGNFAGFGNKTNNSSNVYNYNITTSKAPSYTELRTQKIISDRHGGKV